MQLFNCFENIWTEASKIYSRLSGHGSHIYLNSTLFGQNCKIAVATNLRFKGKFIFLPILTHLAEQFAGNKITLAIAQCYNQFSFSFGINRAYIFFARNYVLRTLKNARLGFSCRNLLRITHIDSVIFNKAVFAVVAKRCPLLSHGRYFNIARSALKQNCAVG